MRSGQVHFLHRRSSFQAYKAFKINKAELQTLDSLHEYLIACNKTIVSWAEFTDTMTGNGRELAKLKGHYWGLQNKDFIGSYEYIRVPGSLCVGISAKGFAVLKIYHNAMEGLKGQLLVASEFKENVSLYKPLYVAA